MESRFTMPIQEARRPGEAVMGSRSIIAIAEARHRKAVVTRRRFIMYTRETRLQEETVMNPYIINIRIPAIGRKDAI